MKTESKNVKTKVSVAAAALPAFALVGEKKFEKMRDKDVKVKDSKTIYSTDTKTKSSSSSSKKNKNKIKKKSESVVFDKSDVIAGMRDESLKSQTQRIELASSFLIETHSISIIVDEDELGMKHFSYPGIVFIRNIKHDNDHVNCYEFNIPMTIPSKSFIFKFNPYLAEMTFEDVRLRIIYLMTEKGLSTVSYTHLTLPTKRIV